jgi:hypothetical protein
VRAAEIVQRTRHPRRHPARATAAGGGAVRRVDRQRREPVPVAGQCGRGRRRDPRVPAGRRPAPGALALHGPAGQGDGAPGGTAVAGPLHLAAGLPVHRARR